MKKMLFVLIILVLAASSAYAAVGTTECKVCGDLKSDDMGKLCGARIIHGLTNAVLGWSEIFFRPGKAASEGGNLVTGFFTGLGNAIARTGGGVVETVTFWTPGDSVLTIDNCPLCAYK